MQRDKKGRFIKKAQDGTILELNGHKYRIKPGATQAFAPFQNQYNNINEWLAEEGLEYLESIDAPSTATPSSIGQSTFKPLPKVDLKLPSVQDRTNQIASLDLHNQFNTNSQFAPSKIKYYRTSEGKYMDQYGKEIAMQDILSNQHRYELDLSLDPKADDIWKNSIRVKNAALFTTQTDPSAGVNLTEETGKGNFWQDLGKNLLSVDKTKLANFLDFARAGIGVSVNNKIAQRALDAEKPFLQDVSESHRSVYGDYRAKVEGEKAAAKLRNMASKPMTSDGALQQQMQLEAQIKGQEYIDQGNAKDDALIKQTREVAWQQEKENQQMRHAVAMQNRQAMLMTQKNKAQIENMRDSANFSQVINPLLEGISTHARQKGAQQEAYQEFYNNALAEKDVWSTGHKSLTPTQDALRKAYLTGGTSAVNEYIKQGKATDADWVQLKSILDNEIIRRQAALRGVTLNNPSLNNPNSQYGIFGANTSLYAKKGGTIYKAKLTKRSKDKDRASRSIESSKKIAARFLEKAMDSLYTYGDVELIAKPSRKRKYQAGGGLPFVSVSPTFATSEKGIPNPTKAASKEKGEDLTTKDLLTLLKDLDGLPADMNLIYSSLQDFKMQSSRDPLNLSSSSDIASRYISLVHKIKLAKFNREEYNEALKQLKSNGGLSEVAITSEGMLIGENKEGDFKFYSPEEVAKGTHQEEGYAILTNSNLLYIRANEPAGAFKHKLTSVAQNGIGMEFVNKLVKDAIANLGTSSSSQEGYVSTQKGELIQGLQDFNKAAQASNGQFDGTVNDLYKYKYLTKSQAEQAKKAMQYLYNTLPSNARALLKVKSDGSEAGALKLIETMISAKESPSTSFDIDLVGGKSAKGTKGSGSGKDSTDLETSLPLNVMKNIGGVDSYVDIDRGDGIHMSVRGTQFNLITTPNGESIADTSLATMLQKSGLQGIVKDLRSIQFGDQKLSPEALSNITYNNSGVTRANLPIKADGSVNLDLLEAYEKAENDIELSGDKSPENIKHIYEQYGITSLLNADGTYNQSKFAPFMITEGYTTDALSGLKTSKFVVKYKGDEDAAVALMQKSLSVGSGKNVQVPEIDEFSWYNPADWFGWTDTIYKGVIYIPITNNVNAAVFGANQSLDYDEALGQEEKYQNFERMSNQRSTNADLLKI